MLIAVQGLALLLVMVGVGKEALQHHGVGALQVVAVLLLLLWVLLLVGEGQRGADRLLLQSLLGPPWSADRWLLPRSRLVP